jgi:predicted transcriptional regulator
VAFDGRLRHALANVQVTGAALGAVDRNPMGKPPARPEEAEAASGADGSHLVDRIASELDLLARNVDILEHLAGKPPMGIIRLSEALHLPIHKVRYSLHLLEREGVIQPSADGAVVTDKTKEFWASLDHSLDKMSELIEHLKDRANEHKGLAAGRKGY